MVPSHAENVRAPQCEEAKGDWHTDGGRDTEKGQREGQEREVRCIKQKVKHPAGMRAVREAWRESFEKQWLSGNDEGDSNKSPSKRGGAAGRGTLESGGRGVKDGILNCLKGMGVAVEPLCTEMETG